MAENAQKARERSACPSPALNLRALIDNNCLD